MGIDEADKERPGLGVLGVLGQPQLRPVGDARVVAQIGGFTRPRVENAVAPFAQGRILPDAANQLADALGHIHPIDFFAEAVVVLGPTVVELADGIGPIALGLQPMSPGGMCARVREGVVPQTDVVDVAPGCQRPPTGHADGTVGVGIVKTRAPSRQPIQMGRLHSRVAITASSRGLMFVGAEKEQVCRSHQNTYWGDQYWTQLGSGGIIA